MKLNHLKGEILVDCRSVKKGVSFAVHSMVHGYIQLYRICKNIWDTSSDNSEVLECILELGKRTDMHAKAVNKEQ